MTNESSIDPPLISPTITRWTAAAGVASIIGGSGFVAYFDPTQVHIFPVCPLYSITGFACPGCGLTRGFHALFHGDLSTALHFNALIGVWAVIVGYLVISLSLHAFRGYGLPVWMTRPKFLVWFMAVLITFGVLRNLPFYPFTLLFP